MAPETTAGAFRVCEWKVEKSGNGGIYGEKFQKREVNGK
jgi:hypothetical protein